MNFLKKLFNKKKNIQFWTQGKCKIDDKSSFHGHSSAQEYCTIKNADVGRYVSMADFVSIGVEEPDFDKISTSSFINGKSKLKGKLLEEFKEEFIIKKTEYFLT